MSWVFVSHSNKDIHLVRGIRNDLEARGHDPVLFFLKCMEDRVEDDQLLWQLIEREIRAREVFLLCDSPNARASVPVQREVELVRSMNDDRKLIVMDVDLTADTDTQREVLARLSRRATVFLSYASSDADVAGLIQRALERHDYRVLESHTASMSGDFGARIASSIDEAAARGFVLVLLSARSVESQWCRREVQYAVERADRVGRSNVIPVVIDPALKGTLPLHLEFSIGNLQRIDLTTGPVEERIEALVTQMRTMEME